MLLGEGIFIIIITLMCCAIVGALAYEKYSAHRAAVRMQQILEAYYFFKYIDLEPAEIASRHARQYASFALVSDYSHALHIVDLVYGGDYVAWLTAARQRGYDG